MTDREAALEAQLNEARLEIKLLREKVDALVRMIYGAKSERLDPGQLTLLESEGPPKKDEAPVAAESVAGARPKPARRSPAGPRLPDHLPVQETIVDPDEVAAAPESWRLMGEEVSEQIDYEPGRFLKKRLVRRKYVRRDHPWKPPVIAPLPAVLQERCRATPRLIAQVVVSKYADHLPLYRQAQLYQRRHDVAIPRQTLCRWVGLAAEWLEPVYEEMKRQQMGCSYLQVDETPIRYLEPGRGRAPQGYFWVTSQPGADVIYHWHASRAASCIGKVVTEPFAGTLQCDGYSAYPAYQKQRAGPVQLASCWAHVRRKFFEAQDRDPVVTMWILGQIGQLYRIERGLRQARAGRARREAVRQWQSAPIVARLRKALCRLKPRYLPRSALGKAIVYALSQYKGLEVFLENGSVELDNNLVENAIRPTKLGAKNWLFIGAEGSGQTSAILYTLVESAKRHGLEPYTYLRDLLETLPSATNHQVPALTPAAYAKRHKQTAA
jgi:transposase